MFTSKDPVGNDTAKDHQRQPILSLRTWTLEKRLGKKKKQPDYKNQETRKSSVSVKSETAWSDCLLSMEVEFGSQVTVLYLGGKQVESPEIV